MATVVRDAKKAVSPEVKKTQLSLQIRETLSNAYSVVMGSRYAHSISSVTLETLMLEQIEDIEGSDGKTTIRLNRLDEIEKIVNSTKEAVKTAKSLPPEAFKIEASSKEQQAGENINTPELPE